MVVDEQNWFFFLFKKNRMPPTQIKWQKPVSTQFEHKTVISIRASHTEIEWKYEGSEIPKSSLHKDTQEKSLSSKPDNRKKPRGWNIKNAQLFSKRKIRGIHNKIAQEKYDQNIKQKKKYGTVSRILKTLGWGWLLRCHFLPVSMPEHHLLWQMAENSVL